MAYLLNSRTERYKNLVKSTEQRIIRSLSKYKNVAVSFSGGKDSTVLLDLVGRNFQNVKVLYIESGASFPDTLDLIETYRKKYDIHIEKSDYTYQDIFAMREERHVSDEQWMKWIVYNPVKRFVEKFDIDVQCIGLRAQESTRRAKRFKYYADERVQGKTGVSTFYPLKDWSYVDVWTYIEERCIPYNTLYDKYRKMGVPDSESRVDTYLECEGYKNRTLDLLEKYYPYIYINIINNHFYFL